MKKSTLNVTKNPQFNSTKNYEYNSNNTLKTLSIDNNSLNYSYLSSQYLSKVELSNNSSYSYSYTEDGFIETIKNNDFILRSDVYDETINGINTGLLTKSYLGSTSSSDYCTYIYDTNNNLIEIHLKSQNLTQISYFNDNSISQVSSLESGIEENYNYDTNGNVIYSNILNKNDKGYYFAQRSIYDNLNNLQGVIKEIGDKKYIYDYSYSYESDETTIDDFLSFLDEIFIGRKFDSTLYQSSLIADNTLKVKNQSGISVVNSGEYTDCLKFGDSSISYLNLINSTENTEYEENYSNVSRAISLWVKCNTISSSQILFTYGEEGSSSSHRFALAIGANKYIELTDRVENRSVTTTNLININKWNLINLYIFKAGSYFSMKLILNGQE
ncbi:MAG: hypothetical protein SOV26_02445, partial [Candidatus Onthovivens sp.]|nr:hypothetical protein [Candidatus Onthovivens sp.]